MSAHKIAKKCFETALAEAEGENINPDVLGKALIGIVVANYLERRSIADVRSELEFLADNCDPDRDYMFMRP